MHRTRDLSIVLLFCFAFSFTSGQTVTERIHVDQFGYLPLAEKVAVISDPQVGFNASESYTPGNTIEVRNSSGTTIFSGNIEVWNQGNTHDQSGDRGWWFDFSEVTAEGTYYVYDPANDTRSFEFTIGENVYNEVIKTAGRMFYYNRCNSNKSLPFADNRWTDGQNFLHDQQDGNCRYVWDRNNAALELDLSGGWFDAGDYNKYVTFAYNVVHDLLHAYEENPQAFSDDWNIPESRNGIPDIIDEIIWELEWLKKMQMPDGSVIIKMGSIDHGHNASAPPSVNTDPRYYGPTCTSSTLALCAMFAHAGITIAGMDGMQTYAYDLLDKAALSWQYLLPRLEGNNLDTECDDGTIKAGDADWSADDQRAHALTCAIYLYEATLDPLYHSYILTNIEDAPVISGTWWGPYTNTLNEALFRYANLSTANETVKNQILSQPAPHVSQDWDGFYGFNEGDLYRAFVPTWAYHWGSNNAKAQFGSLNNMMARYEIAGDSLDLRRKSAEQLHYFHGINPLSLVMLSNMYEYGAEKCANEIYHTWFNDGTEYDNALTSPLGPAPGYVVGGPNKDFSIGNIQPPAGEPAQKAYKDWNTGWPENSWEITEPAIYYQSAYIRLLANFVRNANTTSNEDITEETGPKLYPNPATTEVVITSIGSKVEMFNVNGQRVLSLVTGQEAIDISHLNPGTYIVNISKGNQRWIRKLVKI